MKNNHSMSFLLLITGMTLFLTTCTNEEDPDTTKKEGLTQKLAYEISADTLKSLVTWLEGMGTRFALAENHRDVAENIRRRFVMIGYPETRLDSFMINKTFQNINDQQWQYNVIAYQPGSNQSGWVVNIMDYDNSHSLRKEAEQMCSKYTFLSFTNDNT